MARGKSDNNKIYFKLQYENNDKDNGRPFFAEQKKVDGVWKGVTQDEYIEGKVLSVASSSYEYKKKTQYTYCLVMEDGEEVYSIEFGYGYFSRSILNSIASIKDLGDAVIRLEVYRNRDGFVNVAVKRDGDRTDWALEAKSLPKSEDEKWNGSFDYFIGLITNNIPEKKETADNPFLPDEHVVGDGDNVKPSEEDEVKDLPF